jgi:orotidine-5'-phosphate decarboxylase
MNEKLIVAIDVANYELAKKLIQILDEEVVFFKIGLELMASGDYFKIIDFLKQKNKKIFADLKLHDIAQTVGNCVKNLSQYEIDFLTIHCANRDIMLRATENKGKMQILGVTILTNYSHDDIVEVGYNPALSIDDLVLKKAKLASECGIDGVIASAFEAKNIRINLPNNFLIITPGIRLEKIDNDDQKRVADVKFAFNQGASHIVVGRPITQNENPAIIARKFNKLIHEFK